MVMRNSKTYITRQEQIRNGIDHLRKHTRVGARLYDSGTPGSWTGTSPPIVTCLQ